jgi:hypothetical protein
MNLVRHIVAVTLVGTLGLAAASGQSPQPADSRSREIGRTTEKEIKVVLSSSFGTLAIEKGEPEKIVIVDTRSGDGTPPVRIDYSIRNRVGYMDVALGETDGEGEGKGGMRFSDLGKAKWDLRFSDAVPISFEVELGAGTGTFDLSGLDIKDFNLSTGASEVSLAFDEPNKSRIENLNIESGVSQFEGRNLGNANFHRLKFQGGVGSYHLDFSGSLNQEVDVDAEVGLGVLTLIIPDNIGARIFYQKSWMSSIALDADFRSTGEGEYTTDNYSNAAGKMNIRLDSGLGSIKIRRH